MSTKDSFEEWYSKWTEDVSDKDLHKEICEIAYNAGRESQEGRIEGLRKALELVINKREMSYEVVNVDALNKVVTVGKPCVIYDDVMEICKQALEADKEFV